MLSSPRRRVLFFSALAFLVVVLVIGGIGALVQAHNASPSLASSQSHMATATFLPTATSMPTATTQPTATATPRPQPTATPKPVTNFLVVSIDRGSCVGNKYRYYPTLYFTNTHANVGDADMMWSDKISPSQPFFLHGGDGSILAGGQTGPVEILPSTGPKIPLTITVWALGSAWYPVPGYWQGVVYPC